MSGFQDGKNFKKRVRGENVRSAAMVSAMSPPDPASRLGEPEPEVGPGRETDPAQSLPKTIFGVWGKNEIIYAVTILAAVWMLELIMLSILSSITGEATSVPTVLLLTVILAVLVFVIVKRYRSPLNYNAKRFITITAIALGAFFTLGIVSSPIVMDGKIVPSTSTTAKNIEYITKMRDDLYYLRQVDADLGAGAAASWANATKFQQSKAEVSDMVLWYKNQIDSTSVPSQELVEPTRDTLTAAYDCLQAIDTKLNLLKSDDTKLNEQLTQNRKQFATALTTAGTSLKKATELLGYDIQLSKTNS